MLHKYTDRICSFNLFFFRFLGEILILHTLKVEFWEPSKKNKQMKTHKRTHINIFGGYIENIRVWKWVLRVV